MFQDFAALSFCHGIFQKNALVGIVFLVWHSSKLGQFYPRIVVWYNWRPQKNVV